MPDNWRFFEELGPFGGLMELQSSKQISTKNFAESSNVAQRGGMITPRPGYVRARTSSLISTTSLVGNAANYLVLDTSTGPDRLFYTYGTRSAKIFVDGTVNTILVNYSPLLARGNAVDVAGTTVYVVVTDGTSTNSLRSHDLTGGTQTTVADLSSGFAGATGARAITRNSATGQFFISWDSQGGIAYLQRLSSVGNPQLVAAGSLGTSDPIYDVKVDATNSLVYYVQGNGIYSCTTALASHTLQFTAVSPRGLHVDLTNNRIWWTESDSAGSRIRYAVLTPATGVMGASFTVIFLPSSTAMLGLDVDDTNMIEYFCDSSGSVSSVAADSGTFISAMSMRRSLLGVPAGQFTDDVILLQNLNIVLGGSGFKAYFPARTAPNDFFAMTPGYTAGSGSNPDIFCMISRTANPSGTDPIVPAGNYSRAAFAYTGNGFDTDAAGMIVTASTGAYFFNYRVGESAASEVQVLTMYGTPTGGTFKLKLSTQTGSIAYNCSATGIGSVQAALEGLAEIGVGQVTCSGGPFPGTPITVTFGGTLANTGLPYLYMSTTALTGGTATDVRCLRTTKGRSHPNGILYFRPTNIQSPTLSNLSFSLSAAGNLQGVYSYAVSFYSSIFNEESPPTVSAEIDGSAGAGYLQVCWTYPTTYYGNNYFSGTSIKGGPFIDRVRIYRKRTGSALGSDGKGNGVGADATWLLVEEIASNTDLGIVGAGLGAYEDNVADTSRTADIYPIQKGYPPSNAQYCTVVQGRAYYVGSGHVVWNSELKKVGGIDNGELGFGYVAEDSFTNAFDDTPSDAQITAINHYENQLVVATDERLSAADASNVDTLGLSFRTVPGAAGCASHWCMLETTPLNGDEITGALLLYAHPKGGAYAYNGATSSPIARDNISETIKTFSPKTWQDVTGGFGSIVSWYYATMVIDSYANRILMASPLTAGGSVVMSYCLDTQSWLRWDLNKLCWFPAREWDTTSDRVARDIMMFVEGGSIFKLKEGVADAGVNFDWSYKTGRWHFGTAQEKLLDSAVACFDIIPFDNDDPPGVTLNQYLGSSAAVNATGASTISGNQQVQVVKCGRHTHHQFELTGTQADNRQWPALVSISCKFQTTGLWLNR